MGKIKSYLNKGSHKAWTIGVVVILVVLLFGHHIYTNGGLFTPKTQSFPEQLSKNKGTHVWFFTDDGKAKDSIIDYIMVTKYLAIISPWVRFLKCLMRKSLN